MKEHDTLTAELIKKTALELGADLVGIGSMDRFEGAPPDRDPRFVFPEAKSIIGMGFRIHRGALRGVEEGTAFGMYGSEGYASTNNVYIPAWCGNSRRSSRIAATKRSLTARGTGIPGGRQDAQ